jgi:hypothetical protein
MTDQAAIVCEGREAVSRIRDRAKQTFDDWLLVGKALVIGRTSSMAQAKVNVPNGTPYQKAIRRWLDDNGFGDLDTHERTNAMWMAEHEAEISAWRMRLDPVARRLANHPNTIVKHMKGWTTPTKSGPKPKERQFAHHVEPRAQPTRHGPRLERPEQDMIRYVGDAMRESGKQDWYGLAAVSIEAQRRYENLLDAPAKMPARAPAQLEAAHA